VHKPGQLLKALLLAADEVFDAHLHIIMLVVRATYLREISTYKNNTLRFKPVKVKEALDVGGFTVTLTNWMVTKETMFRIYKVTLVRFIRTYT
jgi:hypothetical protein